MPNTITKNTTIGQSDIDNYSWPVTIENGTSSSPVTVTLETLTFNDDKQYFIIGSNYITITAKNGSTITIAGDGDTILNYPGLIKNGRITSDGTFVLGYHSITIQNLSIVCGTNSSNIPQTSLTAGGGWLCQMYYSSNKTTISNCNISGNGTMVGGCGGLIGAFSFNYIINTSIKNVLTIENCSYDFSTTVSQAKGGIIGPNAFVNSSYCGFTITGCNNNKGVNTSSPSLFSADGGIIGPFLFNNSSYCTGSITNCNNFCDLYASNAGGIVGSAALFAESSSGKSLFNTLTLQNCINYGQITTLTIQVPSGPNQGYSYVFNTAGTMVGGYANNYYNGSTNTINIQSCQTVDPYSSSTDLITIGIDDNGNVNGYPFGPQSAPVVNYS